MITSTDQLNRSVVLSKYPGRIISAVPSITELLFDIGLNEEVAGITKFCIHPETWFRSKTKIGGTKKLNIEKIKSIQPDLIIANKEENTFIDINLLEKDFPVWISDISVLEDAYEMINEVSMLVNKKEKGLTLINDLKKEFNDLEKNKSNNLTCAYIIWNNPIMTAGGDTFINEMLSFAGFENVFGKELRYPKVSAERISELNPDLILLSSEPFPFNEKHVSEFSSMFSRSRVLIVDGEMFSWYGSHLLKATVYFRKLKNQIANS